VDTSVLPHAKRREQAGVPGRRLSARLVNRVEHCPKKAKRRAENQAPKAKRREQAGVPGRRLSPRLVNRVEHCPKKAKRRAECRNPSADRVAPNAQPR
jgi:hypothetical protein